MLKSLSASALAATLMTTAAAGSAQQLNSRTQTPPAAAAKMSRVISQAELQARNSTEGNSLKTQELTVTRECGVVTVGGTQNPEDSERPKSLVGSNVPKPGETVVNAENIVNICRR